MGKIYLTKTKNLEDRDTLLGTYAEPRLRRLAGVVCKTEIETYWDRMRDRERDALGSYAKPRPRRTGIVSKTETETTETYWDRKQNRELGS